MRIETALEPDVGGLARRLRARPGLAVLRSDPRGALGPADAAASFVASDPVEESRALVPPVGDAREPGWAGRRSAPRWIGYVPFEARRALERPAWSRPDPRPAPSIVVPRWYRYDAVLRIDHATGRVVIEADDDAAAERLRARLAAGAARAGAARSGGFRLGPIASDADEAHARAVRRALEYVAAGDVYQVNLARRFSSSFHGSELELFERLFNQTPAPYGFYLDASDHVVVGASPELALAVDGAVLRTGPIKGTRLRGADAASDAALAAELDASAKERAELTMAVDLHRNDLGRVALPGSVRPIANGILRAAPTLWSRLAEVRALADPLHELATLVEAMIPCGSVTGAPKVRAMEIIGELEGARRGLYTGAYGVVGRGGEVTLAVAIRTAVVRRAHGASELEYFAGGGIVWGSDPARETEETRWKALGLFRVGAS